jgi:predicted ester cyclase
MAIANPPTGVSNADLIRWAFERLSARDAGSLAQSIWDEHTEVRFPDRTCRGREEISAFFEETFAAVDGFKIEAVGLAEQGDEVFVRWRTTGTHTGRIFGLDATGKALELDGMDHFTLRDGRVVTNFVIYDQMQFARAIGLMPPDGSAPDRALKAAFNAKTRVAKEIQARRSTS